MPPFTPGTSTRGQEHPPQATRSDSCKSSKRSIRLRCGRVVAFRPLSPYAHRQLSALRPVVRITPAVAALPSSLAPHSQARGTQPLSCF